MTSSPKPGVDAEDQDDMSKTTAEDISASDESTSTALVAVEPEEAAEEDESAPLDTEIGDLDAVASGDSEQHGEQSEASGGEQSEPDQTPEPSPGGL